MPKKSHRKRAEFARLHLQMCEFCLRDASAGFTTFKGGAKLDPDGKGAKLKTDNPGIDRLDPAQQGLAER